MTAASASRQPIEPDTERVVWFNCCAGVAGDMLLGALLDAGADRSFVDATVARLDLDGYRLDVARVQRCGVGAAHARVIVDGHDHDRHHEHHHHHDQDHDHDHADHHPHRPAREVFELIERADLPPRVTRRSIDVYRALAEVEGQIHGVPADDVELHEVGALDSIVDVVGVCAALEALEIERIVCSPIAVGHGTVDTAHGRLPNPVPAVVDLLTLAGAPIVGVDTTMELSTPTGVALMTVLASEFGALPNMTVHANGFGAGTADPPGRPNVVQAIVGGVLRIGRPERPGRPAHLVEANVDDATGEVLAHTIAQLLEAGAHDAWVTPIVMKKGRPAHTVHALCDEARLPRVAEVIAAETGTLGVRATSVERWPRRREERVVEIDGHRVRVKVADGRAKAEHDDAAAAARATGRPLRDVLRVAEALADDETPAGH